MTTEESLLKGCPVRGDSWPREMDCEVCATLRNLARVFQRRLQHERECPNCRCREVSQ